jgi:hypothetical protein
MTLLLPDHAEVYQRHCGLRFGHVTEQGTDLVTSPVTVDMVAWDRKCGFATGEKFQDRSLTAHAPADCAESIIRGEGRRYYKEILHPLYTISQSYTRSKSTAIGHKKHYS